MNGWWKVTRVATLTLALAFGCSSIGCQKEFVPQYVAPSAGMEKLADVRTDGCTLQLIDGAEPDRSMFGNSRVGVAPGKRKFQIQWIDRAIGDTSRYMTMEFQVDVKAGHVYKITPKMTDWKLVAWSQEIVIIDETERTMTYLSGSSAGTVKPFKG